ncbi:MAG TPA: replication-associated recombination protein A [Kofleriaceae bacterium]|nr:replication-associated recombination protein A [Kofleriaceae bacterium]
MASTLDLFGRTAASDRVNQPLAERMRPASMEEYVGQEHLLGQGRLLGGLVGGGRLPSIILYGPPGTGKTTLARLIAERERAHLTTVSAVNAGVKDLREAVAAAAERRDVYRQRTILFVDEIHRFSRAQQDALLPHVEAGTITLIGATTENPSFEVIAPLLSRCRVVRLEPLDEEALRVLATRALGDPERGLGGRGLEVDDDALDQLVAQAAGDARRMLGALEIAAELAAQAAGEGAPARVTTAMIEEALQQRTLLYDKAGDEHYGVVSAFIKSMRGSDPDAAAYWLTRMLEAGEDPRFILRRMVIFASEDVGNADPQALVVATAALQAFELVGLPEGVLPLTQAAVYLACAPKSNTALTTYAAARRAVRERGALPVPARLRNAVTALQKQMGHGAGYRYPHELEGRYVPETYLPEPLVGARFYQPSESGFERELKERVESWRRQVAAASEVPDGSSDPAGGGS